MDHRKNLPPIMRNSIHGLLIFLHLAAFGTRTYADDLLIQHQGGQRELHGEIVVEAADEGILFQTADGRLWIVKPENINSKTDNEDTPEPLDKKKFAEQLLSELPDGFKIHEAGEFLIAYNTERAYARWVGGLYQRLYRGFTKYWQKKKFKLREPTYAMAVIIFASKAEYERYMKRELDVAPGAMVAYYNLLSNRVAMYDLTAGTRAAGADDGSERRINEVLSDPRSVPMVATIIHEGTHQLMFNCGMQTRFSDTPLWINEGLAMYFETPDLTSSRGWRAIGRPNDLRLSMFRKAIPSRASKSMETMLTSSDAFRDPKLALDAYAEAWAFNYFLLNRHSEKYVDYLKFMAEKPQLEYDSRETRLADFKKFFGDDLRLLDREFIDYIENIN